MSDDRLETAAQNSPGALWFQVLNEIGIIEQLATTELTRVLPHGLTPAQFTVLNHCVRLGDNKTPAELAAAFQITRGTLTTTLKRLEEKGFISLIPDATDGRSKRVLLTETGRSAREESIAATYPLLAQLADELPEGLSDTLLPGLQALRQHLDEHRS